MKISDERHAYLRTALRSEGSLSHKESIGFVLEVFSEMIGEAQDKCKSAEQKARLTDLWILVEDAKSGLEEYKAGDK